MAMKYVATSCEFSLYEDDWNEGAGDLISRWDEADMLEAANSVKGLLEQVSYLDCNAIGKLPVTELFENDPCYSNELSRFDADLLVDVVNDNIVKPAKAKIKLFKKGQCKLYALSVSVYVKKQVELDENDVKSWKH